MEQLPQCRAVKVTPAQLVTSQYSTAMEMWKETLAMGQWDHPSTQVHRLGGMVTQDGRAEPCPCLLLNAGTPFLKNT